MRERNPGFTIIELLVVLAIIGVLATIAVPSFLGLKEKASWGTARANLDVMRRALAVYASGNTSNLYPAGAVTYSEFTPAGALGLATANLPADPAAAKLQGIAYSTPDGGRSYRMVGTVANRYLDTMNAGPQGIMPVRYPH